MSEPSDCLNYAAERYPTAWEQLDAQWEPTCSFSVAAPMFASHFLYFNQLIFHFKKTPTLP